MKRLFFISCLLTGLFGCANNESKQKVVANALLKPVSVNDEKVSAGRSANYKAVENSPSSPANHPAAVTRKIIKEGEINFETKSITETRKAIYNSLQKLGGYIAAENETNDSSDTRKMYVLKARIPANNFERFLEGVSSDATKIDSKNIRARDVTSEFIDYTTQLANKKKLEERYVELLKKGTKMSDLLEIEDKINEIETTIDSTKSQLNYLIRQVEYSSLDITFYTKQGVKDNRQTVGNRFVTALSGGWDFVVELFFGCLAIWPLWIMGGAGYFTVRAWGRKHPVSKANV